MNVDEMRERVASAAVRRAKARAKPNSVRLTKRGYEDDYSRVDRLLAAAVARLIEREALLASALARLKRAVKRGQPPPRKEKR